MPVSAPTRRPSPTNNSPQVTRKEKRPALGSTKFCRKLAYQPCTDGCAPVDLASAPLMKPVSAVPLVPQVGSVTFSQPAVNHSAPTFMRKTNHIAAAPAVAKKKREMAGSGYSSAG